MEIQGWKYYNHAAITTTAPHEKPNLAPISDGSIWKVRGGGTPLLARWTTDFDCGYETKWWYVIKDAPFDIDDLKAKRRYEINKGKKNFIIKEIMPCNFTDELYQITVAAYSQWPEKYRPHVEEKNFKDGINEWNINVVLGAFSTESNELCGYAILSEKDHCAEFNVLRVNPESERLAINAAIVAGILEKYNDRLGKDFYINDGSRAIRHETAFQDYLEKYFGFRKAYCKLNIKYRFPIGMAIKVLYPFRNIISKESSIGSLVSGVLVMEEISRSCR